jgi:AraC-like DNA-binding protein
MREISNDLLSQALGLMRVTGSVLLVGTYAPPWAVTIPKQEVLMRLLKPGREMQVATFHLVIRGGFTLLRADQPYLTASDNDVVIAFGGLAHTISQGSVSVPLALEEHLQKTDRTAHTLATDKATTSLICGAFMLRDTRLNPLFAELPPFLHLEQARIAASGLSLTIPDLLANEIQHRGTGSDYAIQRLIELMCLDVLRTYANVTGDSVPGWLQGIKDPVLSEALFHFHQSLGEPWSVNRLAAQVNLSPSRFAARFSNALGESCMTYVTKWRLNVARDLLQTTDESIDEIAHRLGYENVPAFTRVFKRYLGTPPARWRKEQLDLS